MTTARALFGQKYTISSLQRNAASRFWGQLLNRERTISQPGMSETEPLQNEMRQLVAKKDPECYDKFTKELDSLIFEHRHEPLKLESHALPEGVLLEAAKNCNIPLAVFPHHVSMTFTDDNSLRVNNEQYSASQIINEKLGLFAKPKPQETTSKHAPATLSSKNLFHSMTLRLAAAIRASMNASLSTHQIENKSTNAELLGYTI